MGSLRRILDLDAQDVGRSAEAAVALVLARLALRFVRLEALTVFSRRLWCAARDAGARTGSDPARLPAPGAAEALERVAWATNAAAGALGQTCLPRSVALQWMLARRGVEAELCLGFPREGTRLPGHAWIEVGSRTLGHGTGGDGGDGGDGGASSTRALEVLCRLPRRAALPGGPG